MLVVCKLHQSASEHGADFHVGQGECEAQYLCGPLVFQFVLQSLHAFMGSDKALRRIQRRDSPRARIFQLWRFQNDAWKAFFPKASRRVLPENHFGYLHLNAFTSILTFAYFHFYTCVLSLLHLHTFQFYTYTCVRALLNLPRRTFTSLLAKAFLYLHLHTYTSYFHFFTSVTFEERWLCAGQLAFATWVCRPTCLRYIHFTLRKFNLHRSAHTC